MDTLSHRKTRCRVQVALWVRLDVPFKKPAEVGPEAFSQTIYYATHYTDPANDIYIPRFSHLTDTCRKLDARLEAARSNITPVWQAELRKKNNLNAKIGDDDK